LEPTAVEMARHFPEKKVAQMFDVTEQAVRGWKRDGADGSPLFQIEDVPIIGAGSVDLWGGFIFPVTEIDA
jgi:hypothetical protein